MNRVKDAVHRVTAPPGLETRVRAIIREPHAPRFPRWAQVALAAVLLIAVVLGGVLARGQYIAASVAIAKLLHVGVEDHVHCALGGHYPQVPPTVSEMREKLGPEYAGMIEMVQAAFPEYRILQGHHCTANQRRYVHMILKKDAVMLSIVVTRKQPGETFPRSLLLPTLHASGVDLREATVDQLEVSGFETRDHLAYVVSNLDRASEVELAVRWAPKMRDLLTSLEI